MTNVNKYWIIMESLNFPTIGASKNCLPGKEERLKHNLKVLQDSIKLSPNNIVESIFEGLNLQHMENKTCYISGSIDDNFAYSLYSLKMLLDISTNVNLSSDAKEDLISERHRSFIISSINDVAEYALKENLHATFFKEKSVFSREKHETESNNFQLQFLMEALSPLIFLRSLNVGKSLDDVQLMYMASIFSLLIAHDLKEHSLEKSHITHLQDKLKKMWQQLSKKLYFRNLMLLFSSLPSGQRHRIHREMLLRLWSSGGFQALLFATADSQRSEDQSLEETVSNLVAQPNFSTKAQHSVIKQIFQFLEVCLKNKEYSDLMGPAILSLKKMYDNNKENKDFIRDLLQMKMEPLFTIDKSKIIATEWLHFTDLISLLYHIFCTSSIATLPSDLLVCYLPVILELYSQIESHGSQKILIVHLSSLILKTLNNRSIEELKEIIGCMAYKKYPQEWYQLPSNIQIKENPLNMQELKLSLEDNEAGPLLLIGIKHPLASLVAILKNSSYTLLMYQAFTILLQMVPSTILATNATIYNANVDLLDTEDVCNKILYDFSLIYENKIQIIKALETFVQHQPLKTLLNDNIKGLFKSLQDILEAITKSLSKESKETEANTTVLMILLTLIREIVENCILNVEDLQTNLFKPLKELEVKVQDENLKYQLRCLLKTIKGEDSSSCQHSDTLKVAFEEARSLIESHESFLQVQGIEMMIKLLNKRDEYTVTNKHVLIALALNTIKSAESYTFLNCVRLFVALVDVSESEVLEILSDEYLNDEAAMDYRLVIGEAILKTSSEMGPLCYKYKNVLVNSFMAGCRSPLDDFRFSSFSNLSQMCRQLTYQVHNYFQELLNLIDCELTTGKYLPAKRAAVMVLSELLAGMDNLFDYEEMLLPIYRLLKHLVASEKNDEKIRIHALNGLECLSEKCKELFSTGLKQSEQASMLEKEIKIMGIHDKARRNYKNHILEMN